ncbi:MAG: SdiA-regulated domain-containing protein, partial [Paludibacteraceae bacterium]|nr:SdiA-regulated domain-containing protein [Paludibacteraceae bacterium]
MNWPAESWSSAMNLTSKLTQTNVTELSGLHWNPATQCLYVVQDNGRLRILQFNEGADDFFEIANVEIAGNPEGIMQVDYEASMFYTVDEKNYEIRQYVPNQDYTSITLMKKWRLLTPNTPMPDTGNDGIEGIVFVPDKHLQSIGFVSSQTGLPYTSTKGMGGLIFIAHQTEGYVWVYDVNPALSFDVAYVGKYKTNRKESCDIAFDRTTGLLYILHNVG